MAHWLRAVCVEREAAFECQFKSIVRMIRSPTSAAEEIEQPLRFSIRQRPAGIRISRRGNVASSQGGASDALLCGIWMPSARPLTWQVDLAVEEAHAEMVIGVVGRNYRGGSLAASKHTAVVRVNDGRIVSKGADTPFMLRPLVRGDKLRLIVDMQARELTFELVGAHHAVSCAAAGCAATIERIPEEVTVAVGFASSSTALPQRVRLLGCVSDKPVRQPSSARASKGLWDDDNVQQPLHQRPTYKNLLSWRARAPVHCALEEASVASSLC